MKKRIENLLLTQIAVGVLSEATGNEVVKRCEKIIDLLDTEAARGIKNVDTMTCWLETNDVDYSTILENLNKLIDIRNEYLDAAKVDEYSIANGDYRDAFDTRQWHLQAIREGKLQNDAVTAITEAIETAFATEQGVYFLTMLAEMNTENARETYKGFLTLEEVLNICGKHPLGDLHDELYHETVIAEDWAETARNILDGATSKLNPSAEFLAKYDAFNSYDGDDNDVYAVDKTIVINGKTAVIHSSVSYNGCECALRMVEGAITKTIAYLTELKNAQKKLAATADKLTPITTRA